MQLFLDFQADNFGAMGIFRAVVLLILFESYWEPS